VNIRLVDRRGGERGPACASGGDFILHGRWRDRDADLIQYAVLLILCERARRVRDDVAVPDLF